MENLAGENNHASGAVADLLVLRARKLNHALRRGVGNVDFAKNGVAVVREDDACRFIRVN